MNKQPAARRGKSGPTSTVPAGASPGACKATPAARRASDVRKDPNPKVDGEIRRAMIAEAAYYRAEKRGFMLGGELDDWFEAEREVSRILDE